VIWDVHCHFPRDWEHPEAAEHERLVDKRADALRQAGVTRASLLMGGRFGPPYAEALEYARRHEDLFVPVAMVDPEEQRGRDIRALFEQGFRGLKIIGTKRDYDDERYFGVYEAAEELRMPILFHLGVIGGGVDYSITHPRRDPKAAETLERMRAIGRTMMRDVSALRMRPFHLDTIANRCPELRIIGAHMGGTGNYDEAASVARWRHHVLFDLSGGVTIERHAVERGLIGREIGVEKLVWGSDCTDEEVGEHVLRFERMFDDLNLTPDQQDRIWYRNAAELFGEWEPERAAE
jgi:predicted TIM-barrel fold metal-dependent hydrolase